MNKNWKTALAAMGIVPKEKQATMVLEVQDANGEAVIFPDIADVTEVVEGVTVTATAGTHVFEANGNTYTMEVVDGKVSTVEIVPIATESEESLTPETVEMLQAIGEELESTTQFKANTLNEIAEMKATISEMKSLMSHGGDGSGAESKDEKKSFKIGNKEIDLTKINLK